MKQKAKRMPAHTAKLVVHGLPTMAMAERRLLAGWLRRRAREMTVKDSKIFAKTYTARLF